MSNFVISTSLSFLLFGLFGIDWETVDEKIASDYPDIEYISTDELYSLYKKSGAELPFIVDVRTESEFKVGHLQDALNLETAKEISELISDKDADIVVYCSVGYRSAGVAEELTNMSYTNVRNLQHSIFEWANKEYPISNAYGDTDKVHPFNRAWGKLLDDSMHQYQLEKR
ncbi:MAG: rhodanese-like domain-containing protein [Gammaproteobacteria bacterium]|nr:rhodanese-like domain-containing protein [Gammaproteobacteria bacterium]